MLLPMYVTPEGHVEFRGVVRPLPDADPHYKSRHEAKQDKLRQTGINWTGNGEGG